ncbi:MAG: alpha/beta fold hydrolase [Candidatus Sumerlaeaceae bacterium]
MKLTKEGQKLPPIVLLHAFPLDGRMWREQMAYLSAHTQVFAPNVRGFGGAIGCAEYPEWSVRAFAWDLLLFLDRNGLDKVILGGCSMGGYIAFEFWRQYPARVAGMILCDTRAEADTEEIRARRREQIERIRREGLGFLANFVEGNLVSPKTRQRNPALVQEIVSWTLQAHPESVIGILEALASRPDSTETLPTINVPVLLLFGADDIVTPKDCGVRMLARLPQATMEIVADAGHLAPIESPEPVNKAIEDYLACWAANAG